MRSSIDSKSESLPRQKSIGPILMPAQKNEPDPTLEAALLALPGVNAQRAEALNGLGIFLPGDLLSHFPRSYQDRRNAKAIGSIEVGEQVVLSGQLERCRGRRLPPRRHMLTATLMDDSGSVDLVWFNQPYLERSLKPGDILCVFGKVAEHASRKQIVSPEFEVVASDEEGEAVEDSINLNRVVPIYSLRKGLTQRFLRMLVAGVLDELRAGRTEEGFPLERETPFDFFLDEGTLLERGILSGREPPAEFLQAYEWIHFPPAALGDEPEDAPIVLDSRQRWEICRDSARARLAFEERFTFATKIWFRGRAFRESTTDVLETSDSLDEKIRSIFPFQFTPDQDIVVEEVSRDMASGHPMYRLLQGDVGTGKTAVALYALLVAVRNGRQGAIMAPTEILAQQHFATISRYLSGHPGVKIALLTGAVKAPQRREILRELAEGGIHIVVGTHALVQDSVAMKDLGLAIIDEQHRFGVAERSKLRKKGREPHILVMTATPIPRSLRMTQYGDLDLSIIKERPPGRQPVKTYPVRPEKKSDSLEFVRNELKEGRQAFFVFPLVEESEKLDLHAAVEAQEHLAREVFPEYQVGLVHGRLSSAEKDEAMQCFRSGQTQLLVATSVIEVGIDVPNATVLFIENAGRFGLAQLHQLRGRIGRGGHPGFCLVSLEGCGEEGSKRLEIFIATDDGFELAERDLEMRGPGEYLGIRQAGIVPLGGLGDPLANMKAFKKVKDLAEDFWEDPQSAPFFDRWSEFLGLEESTGEGIMGLD